jgi:hypothetical protein
VSEWDWLEGFLVKVDNEILYIRFASVPDSEGMGWVAHNLIFNTYRMQIVLLVLIVSFLFNKIRNI